MLALWTSLSLCSLGLICCAPTSFEMIDMTYTFNNKTLYWPDVRRFQMNITEKGTKRGFWLQLEEYGESVHAGTHMAAPCMYARGLWCADQIPIDRFIAPAAVIDITRQAAMNRDYMATIQDLLYWEKITQHSLDGMIVLLKSGWGKRWDNPLAFIGTLSKDTSKLHFPGFSPEAAQWIVNNRRVIAVGTEALALDAGPDQQYRAHRILFGANIYGLDNIANMDKLPIIGATMYALPMKIGKGSGASVRIIAMVPKIRRQ